MRVVNRCAGAPRALGTCVGRSPPAVLHGRGAVRGSPQEPVVVFPVGFQIEGLRGVRASSVAGTRSFVAVDLGAVLATYPSAAAARAAVSDQARRSPSQCHDLSPRRRMPAGVGTAGAHIAT